MAQRFLNRDSDTALCFVLAPYWLNSDSNPQSIIRGSSPCNGKP